MQVRRAVPVLAVVGVATAWVAWERYDAWLSQLNNSIILQRQSVELKKRRDKSGVLPRQYAGTDYWGNPVRYQQTGADGFILVSYGRDGQPDESYEDASHLHTSQRKSSCWNQDHDTVFSDRGAVRFCLK